MVGSKKCKGCGSAVVNPVTCSGCGIISHPGSSCLARSGHPWHDGKFINCRPGSPRPRPAGNLSGGLTLQPPPANSPAVPQSLTVSPDNIELRDIIRSTIKEELALFRDEMRTVMRMELADMRAEISSLSERVKDLEDRPSISSEQNSSPSAQDILEELHDREVRSRNVIIFGIPEPQEPSPELSRVADVNGARAILGEIIPQDILVPGTYRLGKPRTESIRPLCVRLGSAEDVKSVLRNKHRYKGPFKITEDKTKMERETLMQLRAKLRELHEKGESHMTIRYIHGTPRIVPNNHRRDASQKNSSGTL